AGALLLDSWRLGLGGPVRRDVLAGRERAPAVRRESRELLVVLHDDLEPTRVAVREDVLGAPERRGEERRGEAGAGLPRRERDAAVELAATGRAAVVG